MRFATCLSAVAAVAAGVVSANSDADTTVSVGSGCRVDLSPYGEPMNNAERIVFAFLGRYNNATDASISADCCDWSNTTEEPLSVVFYSGIEVAFKTKGAVENLLQPWTGTYLRSHTDTPEYSDSYPYDFLVTDVSC